MTTQVDAVQLPQAEVRRRRSWDWERILSTTVFGGGAAAMTVWITLLGFYMPNETRPVNWPLVWIGFDTLMASIMALTAFLAYRRDTRVTLSATVLGTMLALDAWFDVTTAAAGWRPGALVLAFTLELPLAAACIAYALRVHRSLHKSPTKN